uniref:Uncharacterized protein n=1 Tax=Trichobilharzia regenti TaxID=157069 RepID=A0AA85JJ67_TRIRE|nr:unnamed protein product [Trichobilharzia regenti]
MMPLMTHTNFIEGFLAQVLENYGAHGEARHAKFSNRVPPGFECKSFGSRSQPNKAFYDDASANPIKLRIRSIRKQKSTE